MEATLDSDGYPTQESLDYINDWGNSFWDTIEVVEDLWKWSDWGVVWGKIKSQSPTDKKVQELELHTGGWSGNEEIIQALKGNFLFWSMCWEMTKKGGHYYFEIPLKDKENESNT